MEIAMNIQKTLFFCVILLVIGMKLREIFPIFKKYCIPSAVVGGLLFAIINLVLHKTGVAQFSFDDTMQKFFMYVFFTCAGFQANFKLLKQGGLKIMIFLGLAALLAFLQNVVAVALSFPLKVEPMIGLMTGSIPMTGGHGNAASFAPIAVEMGYANALNVAIAAATFGLVAGCLVGGPLANRIIEKNNLYDPEEAAKELEFEASNCVDIIKDPKSETQIYTYAAILVFLGLGLGAYFKDLFDMFLPKSINLPIHVMGMIGGCLITNILPKFSKRDRAVPELEIDVIGNVSLALFVTMAIMSMKLWELSSLAGPLVVLLLAQVVLIIIFVRFLTFNIMGRDYDAAVISAGHIGFGMGAVPVSMADMQVVCDKYKMSKLAFFIVPIIGGMFSNFTNAIIISWFMNFCHGL